MKKFSKRIMSVMAAFALVVVLGVCLTACGGETSMETYRGRLENAAYMVTTVRGEALKEYEDMIDFSEAEISIDDIEWMLIAMKGQNDTGSMVALVKFTSEDVAKKAENEFTAGDENEIEDMPEGFKFVRDGKVILIGMEDGVNVALGK